MNGFQIFTLCLCTMVAMGLVWSIIYAYTGYPNYWFRNRDDRRKGELLDGALAMGPEGYERIRSTEWRSRVGGIHLDKHYSGMVAPRVYVHFGETQVTYRLRRDRLKMYRAMNRWERRHQQERYRQNSVSEIEAIEAHLARNADELAALDHRVVKERQADYTLY